MDQRADRMKTLIVNTFFDCLEREDFSNITVGKLAAAARINRSTFYRHFEDKYQLRDHVVDGIVSDFVENLEVDFLDLDIRTSPEYVRTLKSSLEHIRLQKRELQILWDQKLLGRNVFEEMIEGGAGKIEEKIRQNARISSYRKQFADWYARLLLNNMLVSVRWWFGHENEISSEKMTELMRQHMIAGTIPTLKAPETDEKKSGGNGR